MRRAILAHDQFPERAKTAIGVLRYAADDVVAVVDRSLAGHHVGDVLDDVQNAPIVSSVEDLPADAADDLLIGVAPIGGRLLDEWRADILTAIDRGWDVTAGLHDFLADDPEFADRAASSGSALRDVRRPPPDLSVAAGVAREVDATVVATVGTDCSVGKMTASMEIAAAAHEAGIDAAVVPTGQTGILIEGWGIAVDRVPSDFVAGAVEEMVREAGDRHDLLIVEGQGSVIHPAYSSVTVGILHGAMPDRLVLCHAPDRSRIHGYESFPIPPVAAVAELYEELAAPVNPAPVVAGAWNTAGLSSETAAGALERGRVDLSAPVADVVRHGAEPLLEAIT